MQFDRIADYECVTGEGPLWHPDEGRLYWIDIPEGKLFRYDPSTDEHEQCFETDEMIGGFTVEEDGSLLLFMERGSIKRWRDGITDTIIEEIPAESESRFNDVIADPEGRVFAGTMPTDARLGRLYRIDRDGSWNVVMDGIDIPNGMGFTPDRENFYVTDTNGRTIYRFDYDRKTGELSDREVFTETSADDGLPDGMTVDSEGYVWSARWNGGCLVRHAPDGSEDRRIRFPARKVASITFGGEEYTDAYVITAGGDDKETEGDGAGVLFRADVDATGLPEFRSRIGNR